jgi:hypothetical protein
MPHKKRPGHSDRSGVCDTLVNVNFLFTSASRFAASL